MAIIIDFVIHPVQVPICVYQYKITEYNAHCMALDEFEGFSHKT
jgi:hypothetical protein